MVSDKGDGSKAIKYKVRAKRQADGTYRLSYGRGKHKKIEAIARRIPDAKLWETGDGVEAYTLARLKARWGEFAAAEYNREGGPIIGTYEYDARCGAGMTRRVTVNVRDMGDGLIRTEPMQKEVRRREMTHAGAREEWAENAENNNAKPDDAFAQWLAE